MPPFMNWIWAKLCRPWMMLQLHDYMERAAWQEEQARQRRWFDEHR